jgi:hypothetical protein
MILWASLERPKWKSREGRGNVTIAAMDLEDKEAALWKDCAASLVLIHLVFIQFMPEAPAPG